MSKLSGNRSLYDPPPSEETTDPMDAWARSQDRKGSVTWKDHQQQISSVIQAVQSGQISEEGALNLSQRVKGLAPFIMSAIGQRKSAMEGNKLIGKYVNEGRPEIPGVPAQAEVPYQTNEEQAFGMQPLQGNISQEARPGIPGQAAVQPQRNYQGLSDAYVQRGQWDLAKQAREAGGIDKSSGRGEYYVPVQTSSGIKAFNSRSGMIEDASKLPVVGSASDPSLQGKLAGAKAHGAAVGKDVAGGGNLADSGIAIANASSILDKGIYSGAWGPTQKEIAKRFPGSDKTTASNTEEFLSYVGNVVIPMMKDLGGSDTVEELNYMKSLVAGDITMEKSAIRNVLAATRKKIESRQARLKSQAGTVGLGGKANAGTQQEEQPKKNKVVKFSELP